MSDMTKPVHFRLFSCCEATASTAATATSTTSTTQERLFGCLRGRSLCSVYAWANNRPCFSAALFSGDDTFLRARANAVQHFVPLCAAVTEASLWQGMMSEDGAFAVSTLGPVIGRVSRPPCSPAMTPFFGRGQMQFSISFYFALRLQRPHSGNG